MTELSEAVSYVLNQPRLDKWGEHKWKDPVGWVRTVVDIYVLNRLSIWPQPKWGGPAGWVQMVGDIAMLDPEESRVEKYDLTKLFLVEDSWGDVNTRERLEYSLRICARQWAGYIAYYCPTAQDTSAEFVRIASHINALLVVWIEWESKLPEMNRRDNNKDDDEEDKLEDSNLSLKERAERNIKRRLRSIKTPEGLRWPTDCDGEILHGGPPMGIGVVNSDLELVDQDGTSWCPFPNINLYLEEHLERQQKLKSTCYVPDQDEEFLRLGRQFRALIKQEPDQWLQDPSYIRFIR